MEGKAVKGADDEERPVGATFGNLDVATVINGEEYMGDA